jgi:hypothetical protein
MQINTYGGSDLLEQPDGQWEIHCELRAAG